MQLTETIELRVKPVFELIASHDDADSTYRVAAFDAVINLAQEYKARVQTEAADEAAADFTPATLPASEE